MAVLASKLLSGVPFRASAARFIREQAELAEKSFDAMTAKSNARALRLLAEYVESLDPDDQHLAALAESQHEAGGSTGEFAPGRMVRQVLAQVGRDLDLPSSPELLDELVRYAGRDSRTALREGLVASITAQAKEDRRAGKAKADEAVIRAQAKEAKWRERFHHAEAEVADLRKERDHLRTLAEGAEEKSSPSPQATAA
jgi:hypothetical protein